MANPKATIAKAFENLQRSLSPEHRHTFASTELKEVWSALQEIQTSQRQSHSAQNLRRIEPLLRGLEKYAKVIEVLCNGTPYLSFIWAPIKLMIQLASNHRDIFDALLDAYADIGGALPRFDRYEKTFESNPEFQFVLAEVYSTIVEFHRRAYKFFQRRAWHLIFLSLWKDFKARFDGILHTLEKHRDFVDREASSIDMVEDRAARLRMLEGITESQRQTMAVLKSNEEINRLTQFHSSISWLGVDDKKQEAERSRRSGRKHSGTCEWVEQVPEMKAWLEDNNLEPVIWMNGKPGAGKSVMCTVVIDTLDNIASLNVCYYFCNNEDDGRDNPSERILGVIATQLLRAHPELASLITNEFILPGLSSGLAQLRTLVPKFLELQRYTRIVIDGIDECSKSGQKSLLNELQSTCLGPKLHSKILISSRKEPTINAELGKKPNICLDENEKVEMDIRRYVNHKIQLVQSNFVGELEPEIFNQIATSIVDKADGMFLWVRLVTQELEQCFCGRDLEECARSLPHGLKEAYGRILDRILDEEVSPHIRSQSVRILEWMSCSYRRLKIHEILDGVSIHRGRTSLESNTKLHRRVLDLCRPLIEDGPSNTVVFVHFSAQEYILKASYKQGGPFIRPENAHLNIGHSCVAYLNTSFRLLPQNSTEEERIEWIFKGLHGLQTYANQYWYSHIVDYMDQVVAQKLEVPEYLLRHLQEILKYSKAGLIGDSIQSARAANANYKNNIDRLASLQRFSGIYSLVSEVEKFRGGLKRQDWTRKQIGVVSLETSALDPSWLSTACHHYQLALEILLNPDFSKYPTQGLKSFRDTYGKSAFTCRYVHCDRATDGFDSIQQREKHESKHRREYRCDIATCVFFMKGFATRGQLAKHTKTYHPRIADETTLADAARAVKKQRDSVEDSSTPAIPQQSQQQPQSVMQNRPQDAEASLTPTEEAMIVQMANMWVAAASDEVNNNIRMAVQGQMDPATLLQYQARGIDPVHFYYRNRAAVRLRDEKQCQLSNQQAGQGMAASSPQSSVPMQQQRSGNSNSGDQAQQPHQQVLGNADSGFLGAADPSHQNVNPSATNNPPQSGPVVIDSVDEEPYTINCICGYSYGDDNTICCESCDTWQHIECFYPDDVEVASREGFIHLCVDCTPRLFDRTNAQMRQLEKRLQPGDIDKTAKQFSLGFQDVFGEPGNDNTDVGVLEDSGLEDIRFNDDDKKLVDSLTSHPNTFNGQDGSVQSVTNGQPPAPPANTSVISQQSDPLQGGNLPYYKFFIR